MQPQELLVGSPVSPSLPMGKVVALLDSGETLHCQMLLSGWCMGCYSWDAEQSHKHFFSLSHHWKGLVGTCPRTA